MSKEGTFDLEDINAALMDEIVFFDISYPTGMGGPGCVIFITESGDEYIIGEEGNDWSVEDIVKIFPDIYEAYDNYENANDDEEGFVSYGTWKIMAIFAGVFLVRADYFDKFYSIYQKQSDTSKEFPVSAARLLFGRESYAPNERMVYIKTWEYWEQERQRQIAREMETKANRLTDAEVPWMMNKSNIFEGYIKFWIRKNDDGTLSAYRWFIQVQKEQYVEGSYGINPPIECYNLFQRKYENIDAKEVEDFERFYKKYIGYHKAGNFVRSYKEIEKAKEAITIRNEWCGWGNVNKQNVYRLDYTCLKTKVEEDSQLFIF